MDTLQELVAVVERHFPFITAALVLSAFGLAVKQSIFSRKMAIRKRWAYWGRKTLPVHPVIVGALFGLVPGTAPNSDLAPAMVALYYAGAGVVSTWLYSVVKQLLKSRGILLTSPGESVPPHEK